MKQANGRLQIALHRTLASLTVTTIGTRAQADEGRQAVAQGEAIGPKAGDPTITVDKGMDTHPFGMSPSAKFDNGCELGGIEFAVRWNHPIQSGNLLP